MANKEESTGKKPPDDQNAKGANESDIEKLNLSHAPVRRRHMLGSELRFEWDSYTARATKLCSQLISRVATEAGASQRPDKFNVSVIKGEPTDISLTPTNESDESTITARWSEDGEVRFNFERLLKVRPVAIPQGMRAYFEVSRYLSKRGPVLRIHLGTPRLAEIQKTGKKKSDEKKKDSDEPKPSPPEKGTDQPNEPKPE